MVTGYVLAGGRSTRMGSDKAFMPVGDRPLVELVIERLRPSVGRLVMIGNAHNAARLRAVYGPPSVHAVLTDLVPDRGPLMGLYTGLMHTGTDLNVFVPCDMPWVDPRVLARLRQACDARTDVVASSTPDRRIEPFPLICRRAACRDVGRLLDEGAWAVQALLDRPRARLVPIHDPELRRGFTNVNTPADQAQLHADIAVTS